MMTLLLIFDKCLVIHCKRNVKTPNGAPENETNENKRRFTREGPDETKSP